MEKYCDKCDKFVKYKIINLEQTFPVHGEPITIETDVAVCDECGNDLFDEKLDEITLAKLYDKYREKHNLMKPVDIKNLRESYGLSQRCFGRLLKFGDKTINRYENGSLQSQSHNSLMKTLSNPYNMEDYLNQNLNLLSTREEKIIREKIDELKIDNYKMNEEIFFLRQFDYKKSIYSGNKKFDYDKFKNMVLFFLNNNKSLLKTKLMKLLNYSDMYYFKEYNISISGLEYIHYPFGPVPIKFDYLFGRLDSDDIVHINIKYEDNYEKHELLTNKKYDKSLFTKEELKMLKIVNDKFIDYGSLEISNYSHNEEAYKRTNAGELISYEYSKDMKI